MTDSQGRVVSFKDTLIIMTSNIGSKVIEKGGSGLGFSQEDENDEEAAYQRIKALVDGELKNYFRPEFINRIDDIIVFRQLNKEEIREIADILLDEMTSRLEERGITLEYSAAFMEELITRGFDPAYGARPLRRAIMNMIEDPLAEGILSGEIADNTVVMCDFVDGKVVANSVSLEATV